MRNALVIIAMSVASRFVFAFDSAAWLSERNDETDVLRLQTAYTNVAAQVVSPAEDVAFPIETYPDGQVKSRLKAARAFLLIGTDFIWGQGVVAEQYAPDGKTVEGRLTAAYCVVDRRTATGWVKGRAELDWGDTSVAGEDVYFSFRRSFVKIFKHPEIVTKPIGRNGLRGLALGNAGDGRARKPMERGTTSVRQQEGRARIRSERLDYDRGKGVAFFDRNVRLDDPEYDMRAQRLFAFIAGTNDLRRIVASGDVSVRNGDKLATADRIVYLRANGKITLYSGNGRLAELREERAPADRRGASGGTGKGKPGGTSGRGSVVRGDRIVYWVDTDQVEVANPIIEMPGHGTGTLKELGVK